MEVNIWQKIEEFGKQGKPLLIEIINNYGEKGVVLGKVNTTGKKRHYAFNFNVKTKKGKDPIVLDLIIDRPVIMHDKIGGKIGKDGKKEQFAEVLDSVNTFDVLRILDPETQKVIFRNPNKETLLSKPANKSTFYAKDKKNEKWCRKASTKFLLSNIGQYVEVEQNGETFSGILKSVYTSKEKDVQNTCVTLIKMKHLASIKKLEDGAKIKVFPNNLKKREQIVYHAPKPAMEEVIEL